MSPATIDSKQRRLERLDSEIESLKQEFDLEMDPSIGRRLDEVADRLKALKPEVDELQLDLEQSNAILSAILDVDSAVRDTKDELDRLERALLGIERVRQVIRDALDEYVGGPEAGSRRQAEQILRWLPEVKRSQVAELLDVDPRTVRRWAEGSSSSSSHRLELVARLVAVLRHSWTQAGIVSWFYRERRDLDGRRPIDLLDDPGSERALLSAARSTRNQYAA